MNERLKNVDSGATGAGDQVSASGQGHEGPDVQPSEVSDDCPHCLRPENCVYCNPRYKDAALNYCNACDAFTWHLTSDGPCIRCEDENLPRVLHQL